MKRTDHPELVEVFIEFYEEYYEEQVKALAQRYPNEQRSLYIDWNDVHQFESDLAADYLAHPEHLQRYAEEALRLYELPTDVSFGQAHVRIENLPEDESPEIRELSSRHVNRLLSLAGRVDHASDVSPKVEEATFECQLCGTLNRVPQSTSDFQEPHQCQGCERQGPFQVNFDQSEFVDAQNAVIVELAASASEPPGEIRVQLEDDITGELRPGMPVEVVGILRLQQDGGSDRFDFTLEGLSVSRLDKEELETPPSKYLVDDSELEDFVHRTRAVINRHDTLDEKNAKAKIITPLIDTLGWDIFGTEVQLEYNDGELDERVDYALLDADGAPQVLIEAKGMNKILDSASNLAQLKGYMRSFGSEWGILTNGERYIVLREDYESPTPSETRVLDCEVESLLVNETTVAAFCRDAHWDGE